MSDNVTEAIDGLTTAIQGIDATFLLLVLMLIAVALTWAMFHSRSVMLGFPCLMFWAILSGDAYLLSSAVWDIYYFLFWGSIGMAIFSAFAAYGLRTKKEELADGDEFIDEGKDDMKFIDEGGNENTSLEADNDKPSARVQAIRDRAERRRSRL